MGLASAVLFVFVNHCQADPNESDIQRLPALTLKHFEALSLLNVAIE